MTKSYNVVSVLRALLISYLVTGALVLLLAFAMYKLSLGKEVVDFAITFIYILSSAIGGFYIGKVMKQRKFMWGFLVGLLYVAVIFVAAMIMSKEGSAIINEGAGTMLLCIGGGTLGGMLS